MTCSRCSFLGEPMTSIMYEAFNVHYNEYRSTASASEIDTLRVHLHTLCRAIPIKLRFVTKKTTLGAFDNWPRFAFTPVEPSREPVQQVFQATVWCVQFFAHVCVRERCTKRHRARRRLWNYYTHPMCKCSGCHTAHHPPFRPQPPASICETNPHVGIRVERSKLPSDCSENVIYQLYATLE